MFGVVCHLYKKKYNKLSKTARVLFNFIQFLIGIAFLKILQANILCAKTAIRQKLKSLLWVSSQRIQKCIAVSLVFWSIWLTLCVCAIFA